MTPRVRRLNIARWLTVAALTAAAPFGGRHAQAGVITLESDINSGSGSSSPAEMTVTAGELFFSAAASGGTRTLMQYDGTSVTPWNIVSSGRPVTNPQHLTSFNDDLYFTGTHDLIGTEAFRADPGASSVSVWNYPFGSLSPRNYVEYDGKLFLQADWPTAGPELSKIESGTLSLVSDLQTGANGSAPGEFAIFNNELYFAADNGTSGRELYKYDGTSVSLVADINSGSSSSNPTELTVLGDKLVFAADAGNKGVELYEFDGSSVSIVTDLNGGLKDSSPTSLTVYRGELYFQATEQNKGTELYKYDGTTLSQVADIVAGTGSSTPDNLYVHNDELYFSADDGTHGVELHVYDGAGVARVEDLNPNAASSSPGDLVEYGGRLYFAASNGADGRELFSYRSNNLKVNGTTHTTVSSDSYTGFVRVGGTDNSRLSVTGSGTQLSAGQYVSVQTGGEVNVGSGSSLTSAGDITVDQNGVLSGSGDVTGNVVAAGTVAPGNSPGTMNVTGGLTFGSTGVYDFEVNDFTGTMGADPGWDLLSVRGNLTIDPGATLRVNSLTLANVAGDAANFDPTQTYSLLVARTTGSITGNFTLDTSYFTNATNGGSFALINTGKQLYLTFLASTGANVPEPSSILFLGMGLGGAWYLRRKRAEPGNGSDNADREDPSESQQES